MGSDKKNELFVTEKQVLIKFNSHDGGCITHQYDLGDETDFGELSLIKIRECLETDGWNDRQEFEKTESVEYLYSLEAVYEDGSVVSHHGAFDRAHIPEKPFRDFSNIISFVVYLYGFGEIVNLDGFMNALKPGEVKYCGVEFSDSGRVYHYRTTDTRIKIGDKVIVPVGEDNYAKEVTVKTIEYCRWDDTPYPLEKTKEIIKLADEKFNNAQLFQLPEKTPYFLPDKDITYEYDEDEYED